MAAIIVTGNVAVMTSATRDETMTAGEEIVRKKERIPVDVRGPGRQHGRTAAAIMIPKELLPDRIFPALTVVRPVDVKTIRIKK